MLGVANPESRQSISAGSMMRQTAETGASQTRYFESLRRAFFFARDRRMQHFERHPPVACHDEDRGSAIDDEEAARGNAYAHQGTSGTRSRATETDRADDRPGQSRADV